MSTRRNPVVRYSTLLRKGGAHAESVSGKRHQSKRQLDDEIDEYYDQRVNTQRRIKKERDDSAPSSPLILPSHQHRFTQISPLPGCSSFFNEHPGL